MTIREIARSVGLSATAVRHWLRRYGLRTKHTRGRRPRIESPRAVEGGGDRTVVLECRHHGETEFALEGRGVLPM